MTVMELLNCALIARELARCQFGVRDGRCGARGGQIEMETYCKLYAETIPFLPNESPP